MINNINTINLTNGTSPIEYSTTPWYCGVLSVIRPRPLLITLCPYTYCCSAPDFSHTLYYKLNKYINCTNWPTINLP